MIRFQRSGGFTGLTLKAVIDTAQLDHQTRQDVEELVDSSNFFEISVEAARDDPGVDRIHYLIWIKRGAQQRQIETSEGKLPEPCRPLVRKLSLLARDPRFQSSD